MSTASHRAGPADNTTGTGGRTRPPSRFNAYRVQLSRAKRIFPSTVKLRRWLKYPFPKVSMKFPKISKTTIRLLSRTKTRSSPPIRILEGEESRPSPARIRIGGEMGREHV